MLKAPITAQYFEYIFGSCFYISFHPRPGSPSCFAFLPPVLVQVFASRTKVYPTAESQSALTGFSPQRRFQQQPQHSQSRFTASRALRLPTKLPRLGAGASAPNAAVHDLVCNSAS